MLHTIMSQYRKGILFGGDLFALGAAFLAVLLREGKLHLYPWVFQENIVAFSFVAAVTVLMLYSFDLYDFRFVKPVSSSLWRVASALIISPIIGIIFFYALPYFHVTPKTNLVVFFAVFGILFLLWRRAFFSFFSQSFQNKTVVWGTSGTAEYLFQEIEQNPHRGYSPFLLVRELDELITALDEHHFHILVIDDHLQLPDELIESIFKKKITVLSLLETYEQVLQKVPVESVDETVFIQNMQNHRNISAALHRVFECFAASLALFASSPFWIIAAIAIKLEDRGPFFYLQPRMGYLGETFMLYKFRSMTVEEKRMGGIGSDWTDAQDPRVTRIGRIIRKLHIDEIPQMINILKGDITLVGPRPDVARVEQDLKKTVPHYHLRHVVKPGFTGWAQIKYHAPSRPEEFITRFEYDLFYIKNREFFFDLGIIARTLQIILSHSK